MFPSAIGILFSHAPQEKRAKYMAMFFAITGGMTAIGPIAGSYLITFSWRAVFFINLPLAIAAVSLIWALTPADGNTGLAAGLASMDWPGAVLVAMAMAQIGARIFDAHGIRRVLLVAGLLSIIGFGRLYAIAGGLDAGVPPVSALTVPLMLSGAGIGKRNHLPHDGRGGTGVPSHRGVLRARQCPPCGGAEPQSCGTAGPQRGAIGRCHGLTPSLAVV